MNADALVREAIGRAGATAWLLGGAEPLPFPASVQPQLRDAAEQSGPLGVGYARRLTLYAPCGTNADALREDCRVRWMDREYCVRQLETVTLAGRALYYWARLLPCEGGGGE